MMPHRIFPEIHAGLPTIRTFPKIAQLFCKNSPDLPTNYAEHQAHNMAEVPLILQVLHLFDSPPLSIFVGTQSLSEPAIPMGPS